ncbi:putative transcription factor MYB-HB-like family [Helianthus annuus]|nr:putative transcription factor MYB-HB-like family [Helianthus annuus]
MNPYILVQTGSLYTPRQNPPHLMTFHIPFDPSNVSAFRTNPMVFDNTKNNNFGDKMQRVRDYVEALESERRKIQVFERELPLCLELVTQAIEGCRRQMSETTTDYNNGQDECSEQTSSLGLVLEEFIPIKRINEDEDEDEEEDEQQLNQLNNKSKVISSKSDKSSSKKSDWLRHAQLSIQSPDPLELSPKRVSVVEVTRNGCGAFHPFRKEKSSDEAPAVGNVKLSAAAAVEPAAAASSTEESGGGGGGSKGEDKGQSNRKARRCWSPELHRRFLHALQQLGGAHVATPKQIRELMKVDGLTNDEVKSHLQKYRLHTRRPSPTIHNNNNSQTPQFVVVGGIWMPPPPEYTTMASTASTPTSGDTNNSKGVYAPIASHPPSMSLNKSNSGEKNGGHSHHDSPSTSSSTHTTTTSPAF